MEEYLQCMKALRSQMNDVEDQAAKMSVEEQTLVTTISTMEKDLASANLEAKQLKADTEQMLKAKGHICSQILEKKKKIGSLESDSSTLAQTLELVQQERVSLSAKFIEKSAFYTKVADDLCSKLQQQQDWISSFKISGQMGEQEWVKEKFDQQTGGADGITLENLEDETRKTLLSNLDSAKTKLREIVELKSKLVAKNDKMKQSIEQVKCKAKDFKPELLEMDIMTLEEEYNALLSDKAEESKYLHSIRDQIQAVKGISDMIKCACGLEYMVAVDLCA